MALGRLLLTVWFLTSVTLSRGAVPVFVMPDPLGTTSISIAEDTSTGTTVYAMSGTDADEGDTLTYGKFTGVGFAVEAPNYVVTTMTFDASVQSVYSVTVSLSDGGITVYISMTITIAATAGANSNGPVFLPTIYATNMMENSAAGTSVAAVTCSDVESTTCVLQIQSGDESSAFSISGSEIQTSSTPVDYETLAGQNFLYTLTVIGVDTPGTPSSAKTGTALVYITVRSQNDNTPSISGPSSATIAENSSIGTTVLTMTASDADLGNDGVLTYSIVGGNTGDVYGVVASTGVVYLASTLDYETTNTYNLVVKVMDGGNTVLSATSTVTISLTDVNDNSPNCSSPPYIFAVNEQTSATPVTITTLSCSDVDTGTTLQYAITAGNSESCFHLHSSSGVLTTSCALDYDNGSQHYALVTTVTDGTYTSTVTITINLTPVNEATPTFGSAVSITVDEDTAPGTHLASYVAGDTDASPHGVQLYDITSVTNSGSSLFAVDKTNGSVYLAQTLDYETSQTYTITVEASDGSNTGTGTITVNLRDINDIPPSCSPATHATTIPEGSALGTVVVADLSCSDGDAGTTLVYSTSSNPGPIKFATSATGGVVSLVVSDTLDYETVAFYQLSITVSDGVTSATVSVAVNVGNVNEAGPVFNPVDYTVTKSEATAVGTVIATVVATDADTDTIMYSFVTTYAGFMVDASTGAISLATNLDYESATSHQLIVKASDGTLHATATVSITVVDADESTFTTSSTPTTSTSSSSSCPPFYETTLGIGMMAGVGAVALVGLGVLVAGIVKLARASSAMKTGSAKLIKSSKVVDKVPDSRKARHNAWTKGSFMRDDPFAARPAPGHRSHFF